MANRYITRPFDKLSEDDIHQIWILIENGFTVKSIREIFNISRHTYYVIFNEGKPVFKIASK